MRDLVMVADMAPADTRSWIVLDDPVDRVRFRDEVPGELDRVLSRSLGEKLLVAAAVAGMGRHELRRVLHQHQTFHDYAHRILDSRDFDFAAAVDPATACPGPDLVVGEALAPPVGARFRPGSPVRSGRLINASDAVLALVLRLVALWRRVDRGRFARALALALRSGRLWVDFRPVMPPGRLVMTSGHVTRGPDAPRMTQALIIRGEPLALT